MSIAPGELLPLRFLLRSPGLPTNAQSVRIQSFIEAVENLLEGCTDATHIDQHDGDDFPSDFDDALTPSGPINVTLPPHTLGLHRLRKVLKSLSSPLRKLPVEIMTEIFVCCLPANTDTPFIKPSSTTAPLLLTQVCGAWRDLTFSTPYLWRSLSIPDHPRQQDSLLALAEVWLTASGTIPLALEIPNFALISTPFMNLLNRFSPYWSEVHASFSERELLPIFPKHLPLLRSFSLTSLKLDERQAENLSTFLSAAPSLRVLHWENAVGSPLLDPNWERFTHIRIDSTINVAHCLEILRTAVNLQEVAFLGIRSLGKILPTPITCHHLRVMIIRTDTDLSRYFDALTCPSLDAIALKMWTNGEWTDDCFPDFLSRSRCPLENLDLYFCVLSEELLLRTLRCVHATLKELTIQGDEPIITDRILGLLTYPEQTISTTDKTVFCPRLELLGLYTCISCTKGRLTSMIRSRLNVPQKAEDDPTFASPLALFETYNNIEEHGDIEKLRSEGLVIKSYSFVNGQAAPLQDEEIRRLDELRSKGNSLRTYFTDEACYKPMPY